MRGYTLSLKNINEFEQYVASWFIESASIYLLGLDIRGLATSDYRSIMSQLYSTASNYLRELNQPNVCDVVPIPITPNDDKTLLNLCKAVNMLSDAFRGVIDKYPIPPALSFEFAEYIRGYMPYPTDKFKKRNIVEITNDALGLAILGAHITYKYRERDEYAYSFTRTSHPQLVDMKKLRGMTMSIARAVARGEGSRLTLLIGVSSAIVLNLGKKLYNQDERTFYTAIRITRTGNKTMLKAYDSIDLTDLARTISKLGIASAIYDLIASYPSKEDQSRDKRARAVRSLIEELSKAIWIYYDRDDPSEIYKVIRTLSSDHTRSIIGGLLPNWPMILYTLLNIKV